jgi:hypothetical protein
MQQTLLRLNVIFLGALINYVGDYVIAVYDNVSNSQWQKL